MVCPRVIRSAQVSEVTRLQAVELRISFRLRSGAADFSLGQFPDRLWTPPSPLYNAYGMYFIRGKVARASI